MRLASSALGCKVSVILPIYNGARFVREAIDSVLAQSYRAYEVVIVNDGSLDESEAVIRPYYLNRPNFKYVAQSNQGVAAARNAGIALAEGELLTLLDQDDLWLPEKLAMQVRYMDEHPEVGLLHTLVGFVDAQSRAMDRVAGWVSECSGWCTEKLLQGNPIAPLTAMFRRSCVAAVGGFDSACESADDWDLWLRISRHAQVGFLDVVTGLYRYHESNVSKNVLRMKLAEIRVVEGFVRREGSAASPGEQKVAEAKLGKFYRRAVQLLREAGRDAEASALLRRLFRLRLAAVSRRLGLSRLRTPAWSGVASAGDQGAIGSRVR